MSDPTVIFGNAAKSNCITLIDSSYDTGEIEATCRRPCEVFTPVWLVEAMLDLVQEETERIDSRFLEPVCRAGLRR